VSLHVYLLFATMREQVVPSAVVTSENMRPAEILTRLRAQFGYETLSRTQWLEYII